MGLLSLPDELLLAIVESVEYGWDMTAFGAANRRLHGIVNDYLYQRKLPTCSNESLLWAFEHCNEDAVSKCLEAGALDYADKAKVTDTAMWRAISRDAGHHRTIERLVEIGLLPIQEPSYGGGCVPITGEYSPLSMAVQNGHISVVRVMLAHGAENFHWGGPVSLLAIAAGSGDLAMMEFLMEEGYEPNQQVADKYPPLSAAAIRGHTLAAELLLQRGANPNVQIEDGSTPIKFAAGRGHIDVVRLLIKHGAIVNPIPGQKTRLPICAAMRILELSIVSLVADHMDLDLFPAEREDQLMRFVIAAATGRDQIVQELLQRGFSPEDTPSGDSPYGNIGRMSALQGATLQGHESVVKTLLDHGADVIGTDTLSSTVRRGHSQTAKILLERNLDRYRRANSLDKILLSAMGDDACFELLLEHGANPGFSQNGKYLIQYVIESGRCSLLQILLDRGVPLEIPPLAQRHGVSIVSSAVKGGIAMLEFLAQKGFDIRSSGSETQLALRYAIRLKNVAATSFLLRQGFSVPGDEQLPGLIGIVASLKPPDTTGEALLDTLLSRGVAINSRDEEGQTCAWRAIDRCEHLEILLQKGADPLLRDKNGETSLTYAATQSRGLEIPAKVESVKTILGWIDLNWSKLAHDEIHQEVSKAETGAVAKKNWKTVRLLQRFRRVHFEGM